MTSILLACHSDGDKITVDAGTNTITWHVPDEEAATRRKAWEGRKKNELKVKRGVLYRYARDVAVRGSFGAKTILTEFFILP